MKNKLDIKKITVLLFLVCLFITPITMIVSKDKTLNEIENKILQQFPDFNYNDLISGRFMDKFDTYVSDQFPNRNLFLYTKNKLNFILGQREFRDIYITKDGSLLEKYIENKDLINKNILNINDISRDLNINSSLFVVPNSIAIYKDKLPKYMLNDSQEDTFELISNLTDINFYTPFEVLKNNKEQYIYFNTDHHWTQLGAKIAFEDFYNEKVEGDYSLVSNSFYGTYYSKVMLKNIKSDKIYAYSSYEKADNVMDGIESNYLYNKSKLNSKNKYQYFLNGDPAEGVINGNGKGEILIIKDSFAHNFIPFLIQKFDKIHFIDPRYSNKDIREYLKENKKIEELMFLFSLSTLNSSDIFKR